LLNNSKTLLNYWKAYKDFYSWSAIFKSAWVKPASQDKLRHLAYTGAWKKCEPIWDFLIRAKQVNRLLPTLENVLTGNFPLTFSPANRS